MNQKVEQQWQALEQKRLGLFAELKPFSDATLGAKPRPDAWSVLQVMKHLADAEAASLSYMQKKMSHAPNLAKAGFKSRFRRFLLRIVFALPLKFKAPSLLGEPSIENFAAMHQVWNDNRAALHAFIESLPDATLEAELWRHQIAGKMSIAQMLNFFEDHFDRHYRQIQRTLAEVS